MNIAIIVGIKNGEPEVIGEPMPPQFARESFKRVQGGWDKVLLVDCRAGLVRSKKLKTQPETAGALVETETDPVDLGNPENPPFDEPATEPVPVGNLFAELIADGPTKNKGGRPKKD